MEKNAFTEDTQMAECSSNIMSEKVEASKLKNSDVPPTRKTVHSEVIQPGLGPQNLDELWIEPEDIGLKKPVVILDYPSPDNDSGKYSCCSLSLAEIKKCREKFLNDTYQPGRRKKNT